MTTDSRITVGVFFAGVTVNVVTADVPPAVVTVTLAVPAVNDQAGGDRGRELTCAHINRYERCASPLNSCTRVEVCTVDESR